MEVEKGMHHEHPGQFMKPNIPESAFAAKDPAFAAMTMDLLSSALSRADNPAKLGDYLAEEPSCAYQPRGAAPLAEVPGRPESSSP